MLHEGGDFITASFRGYLTALVAAALIVSLTAVITPEGSGRRIVRFAGGLVLILTVLSPLLKLQGTDLSAVISAAQAASSEQAVTVSDQNQTMLSELICEQTESYILDKAAQLGLTIRATVQTEERDGQLWPSSVTLEGEATDAQKARLTAEIEADLAIPADRQEWI